MSRITCCVPDFTPHDWFLRPPNPRSGPREHRPRPWNRFRDVRDLKTKESTAYFSDVVYKGSLETVRLRVPKDLQTPSQGSVGPTVKNGGLLTPNNQLDGTYSLFPPLSPLPFPRNRYQTLRLK